ncbi:hypothetical protein [Micromonospora sp. NPDC023737]|uniref:hypothetical protein n=1 Tax=unclassified Micromonospora TaxID=2617518 RepID=UPI0033EBDD21
MAQGEADHGCARGEPCRPGNDQQAAAKPRRLTGGLPPFPTDPAAGRSGPAEPAPGRGAERPEEDVAVPRQRSGEPVPPAEPEPTEPRSGCRSELPGWAGAHRHGAVRPPLRDVRRERPPRRWC